MHPTRYSRLTPDKAAIIHGPSAEVVSFSQLEARTNRFAHLFRQLGIGKHGHLALMVENRPLMIELCFAALRAGIYFTPISTRLKKEELAYIIGNCGAKAFITTASFADVAREVRPLLSDEIQCLIADGDLHGYQSLEAALATQSGSPLADESAGMAFFYSSGTTGRPKGVKRFITEEAFDIVTGFDHLSKALYGYGSDMVYLSPAPMYHAAPLTFLLGAVAAGGTLVIMDKFDAEQALSLIERHRVTHSQWVPTMFSRMLRLPETVRQRCDLSSMRVAIHAGAPCPPEIKRQMIDWWGRIIVEYYSGTEGVGMCHVTADEWLQRPGTVGKPVMGKIHILDDDGHDLPVGETGSVYFEGTPSFEYHGDPEKTRAARTVNGWGTMGDVGYIDRDGYLFLTDRKDFMIISGGVNIYPAETESVLMTHPAVVDVAVIGVPNEEFGEEVKAVVQLGEDHQAGAALAEELIRFCRERLADLKCPRSVDFVSELPRLPTGKLQKKLVRALTGPAAKK